MRLLTIAAVIALAVAAACGSTSSASSGGGPVTGKVHAVMTKTSDPLGMGDKHALKVVTVADVWCAWSGDQVELHATFKNPTGTHVTIHVTPTYALKNAGVHGNAVTDDQSVGVNAGATRSWLGNLGQPAGGPKAGTLITHCKPQISYVELG